MLLTLECRRRRRRRRRRRCRQMVPRLKDDNANQRPNIESLEVDKILHLC